MSVDQEANRQMLAAAGVSVSEEWTIAQTSVLNETQSISEVPDVYGNVYLKLVPVEQIITIVLRKPISS